MTTISIAIILLVVIDIAIIREMDKMKDDILFTIKSANAICDVLKEHMRKEGKHDERTSD